MSDTQMLRRATLYEALKDSGESEPKKLNEKKGGVGLWQCSSCVPSALLLNALNFALNFFLFNPAFFNILCKHYRTNTAIIVHLSNL